MVQSIPSLCVWWPGDTQLLDSFRDLEAVEKLATTLEAAKKLATTLKTQLL